MNTIKNFLKDESGLELTEYAIAAGIIAVGVVGLFTSLGGIIKTKISAILTEMGGTP
jgi:pilus assembly protein Flp/PilA